VVACLLKQDQQERRTFSTMPDDVLRLADWLVHEGCTPVAIESPGVYWKPVCNILAGRMEVILVSARHGKAVPGHKTEARDSAWVADLLRPGLRKASCIPPRHIRDLRERTRYRRRCLAQCQVSDKCKTIEESIKSIIILGRRLHTLYELSHTIYTETR
jgi:hypothetical protein